MGITGGGVGGGVRGWEEGDVSQSWMMNRKVVNQKVVCHTVIPSPDSDGTITNNMNLCW